MNKLVNFGARPLYFFSSVAKKKQMELTLRTPYSIHWPTQKLSSLISLVSPGLLPNRRTLLWWFRTELLEPCTCYLPDPSKSN